MTKGEYTYVIMGGIINGCIRDNIPVIHNWEIKTSKDLISVEVEEGRVSHHMRDRTSTVIDGSMIRRHVDV